MFPLAALTKKTLYQANACIIMSGSLQCFVIPALAETNNNSAKEANFVVKKNGRIFLIYQSTIKEKTGSTMETAGLQQDTGASQAAGLS